MSKNYIAYGLNMDIEYMKENCPNTTLIGTGVVKDYNLYFKGCATIEKEEGKEVPVVVWSLDGRDEKRLDLREGYPSYYYKDENIAVTLSDGTKLTAMGYIMSESDWHRYSFSSYYIQAVREYYKYWGFKLEKINEFILDTKKKIEESGDVVKRR